jgi:hypothetical protein
MTAEIIPAVDVVYRRISGQLLQLPLSVTYLLRLRAEGLHEINTKFPRFVCTPAKYIFSSETCAVNTVSLHSTCLVLGNHSDRKLSVQQI